MRIHISKKKAVEQFIHWKNLYQLGAEDKEMLIEYTSDMLGIDKEDFIEAVNTELEKQKKVQKELEKKITFPKDFMPEGPHPLPKPES
jgi:hypothetical protein